MPDHLPRAVRRSIRFLDASGGAVGQHREAPGEPIARAVAAWMRRLEGGSPQTARNYRREAQAFLDFLALSYGPGLGGLLRAKPSDCIAFVNAVPDLAPASRAVKASVIRGLLGALVLEGLRDTNPATELGLKNVQSGRHHQAIPQAAIVAVLERLRTSEKIQHVRDRALLLLALAVGARRFELVALNVGSIQRQEGGKAQLAFTGKGKRAARMAIRPGVLAAIDRWLALAGQGANQAAPLFHCLSRRPEHRGRRLTGCGIRCIVGAYFPGFSPHGLRARSITDIWTQSGGNLGHAQAFGRHSSPAITERIYIQAPKLEAALEYTFDYA